MAKDARDAALVVILRAFLGVGSRLPLQLSRRCGPAIGRLAMLAAPRDRRRVVRHLTIAFPELSDERRQALAAGCARHFGLMLAEVAWLTRAPRPAIERLCTIAGFEHFERALAEGRGVMFTTAHAGNWELISARLPIAGTPLITAVRKLDNPRIDTLVNALRARHGTEVVPRSARAGGQLARAIRRNRVVGLLIDQDIRNVPGVFVPFFDRPAWTPSGAATLAIRLGCPMIPGFIHRKPDLSHHIELFPPLESPRPGSLEDQVVELTTGATAAIENQIRTHPEQWVWMHRRWRTRPNDQE
jgi:KDO2-lipid IV(A) lauroyltransferase